MTMSDQHRRITAGSRRHRARDIAFVALALSLTVISAIAAKRVGMAPPLVAVDTAPIRSHHHSEPPTIPLITAINNSLPSQPTSTMPSQAASEPLQRTGFWTANDGTEYFTPEPGHQRYFRGRPIRPARTVWMVVTAYSPDHRSCGKWADGITASLRSVWTNGMELVAADTRLFPMGTLVSVPGYAGGRTVPVLDRGGAIKGARLDVLYPTHQIARRWGVQRLPVVIWEYADKD